MANLNTHQFARASTDIMTSTTKAIDRSGEAVTGISFLDLPAEIRNAIYQFALVEDDKPIDVIPHPGCRVEVLSTGLLQANRQIRIEATPVFYGMNSFTCTWWGGFPERLLYKWLTRIGESRRHLRIVQLGRVDNQQILRSALNQLKDAKDLEALQLSWFVARQFGNSTGPSSVSRYNRKNIAGFLPWLRVLQKARKANRDSRPVTSVIRLEDRKKASFEKEDRYQAEKARVEVHFADMKAQLEESLAS